jgi:hypothetical protein
MDVFQLELAKMSRQLSCVEILGVRFYKNKKATLFGMAFNI